MNFENYSVKELEDVIIRLYKQEKRKRVEFKGELEDALYERQRKLNQSFEWTPENKEKLLLLNQKLIECWEKLDVEARQMLKTIKNRLNKTDNFLQDYNLEAVVEAAICFSDENGKCCAAEDCIEEVLNDSLHRNYAVNYESCFRDDKPIIYLDREQNWNKHHWFKGNFDEHFISQAINDLYDDSYLSFPDILKINNLWAEVRVDYQHSVDF